MGFFRRSKAERQMNRDLLEAGFDPRETRVGVGMTKTGISFAGRSTDLFAEGVVKPISNIRKSPVTKSMRRFARQGLRQPKELFTDEQNTMQNIMGGGAINRMWGFNNNPVQINNTLNPRQYNEEEDGTAQSFGFGRRNRNGGSDVSSMFGF
jgi:hypothetical protein